ncbi:hypothetical protein BJ912DRAFT_1063872 [Pholiota molesta]|nr:hypothetical protein BJ912DRAFT_1063872 [Pholiota molesta]
MSAPRGRPYFAERLLSIAGYACVPVLYDALSYWLPPFNLASSRIVAVGKRMWELWSPNSSTLAYYPGLKGPEFNLGVESEEQYRRCDGHLGRFDPTISPQILIPSKLWYPFVRRSADPAQYPEFSPFLSVWQQDSSSVDASFVPKLARRVVEVMDRLESWRRTADTHPVLWNARPSRPNKDDVLELAACREFPAALDLYSRIQRGTKLASAWCRMAHSLHLHPPGPPYNADTVVVADDTLMGAWINGTSEEEGRWLLKLRVPCYIIHEQDTEIDYHHAERAPRRMSFFSGTTAADLAANTNPLDMAVIRNGGRLMDIEEDLWMANSVPPSLWRDRVRSSTHGQGWKGGKYAFPGGIKPAPFSERDGHIIPPAVIAVGTGPGKWSSWKEDVTDEGDLCFTKMGKTSAKLNSGKVWFDRTNRRILKFESRPSVPRFYSADEEVFGIPAPQVVFREEMNEGRYRMHGASTWIYKFKDPKRENVGREFQPEARRPVLDTNQEMDVDSESDGSFILAPPRLATPPPPSRERRYSPPRRSPSIRRRSPSPRRRSPSPRRRTPSVRRRSPSQRRYSRDRSMDGSPIRGRQYSRDRSMGVPSLRDHRAPSSARYQGARTSSSWNADREWRHRSRSRSFRYSRSPRSPSHDYDSRPRTRRRLRSPSRGRSAGPSRHRSSSRSRSYSPARSPLASPGPRSPVHYRRSPSRSLSRGRSVEPHAATRSSEGVIASDENTAVVATRTVRPVDLERMRALFPEPPPPRFATLREIGPGGQSSILAISNLPVYYLWIDVLSWLRDALTLVNRPRIDRVLRTLEDGYQVFWIKMRTPTDASTLRGLLAGRRVSDSPFLRVDFVDGNVYSSRCTLYRDAWSPSHGMELENRLEYRPTALDRMKVVPLEHRPASMPLVDVPSPPANFLDRLSIAATDQPVASSSVLPPVSQAVASSSAIPLQDRFDPIAASSALSLEARLDPPRSRKRARKPRKPRS